MTKKFIERQNRLRLIGFGLKTTAVGIATVKDTVVVDVNG